MKLLIFGTFLFGLVGLFITTPLPSKLEVNIIKSILERSGVNTPQEDEYVLGGNDETNTSATSSKPKFVPSNFIGPTGEPKIIGPSGPPPNY